MYEQQQYMNSGVDLSSCETGWVAPTRGSIRLRRTWKDLTSQSIVLAGNGKLGQICGKPHGQKYSADITRRPGST